MSADIRALAPNDFPPLLREIPGAPKRLYIRGTLPDPDTYIYVCVVGSRAATAYGRRACQSLIAGLAGRKIAIVSGLALGMDAQAHEAALSAGLPTVAVLPSGLGERALYPATNQPLAHRILERGGALISEYEEDVRPAQWHFPARNRVMAGLCRATLIVEASEKSGTLITARLALDFNREVWCVPHPIGAPQGAGNNRLIREGAMLVRGSDDILDALGIVTTADPRELPADLSDTERALMRALTEPLTRDELIERASLSAQAANIAISSLSIRGLIDERLGKFERN